MAVHAAAANARLARGCEIEAVVLETPFVSVRRMLETVYPQWWVPYRYLWPFLWNRWDSAGAICRLGGPGKERWSGGPLQGLGKRKLPRVLILQAGKDELVPASHGEELEGVCKSVGMDVERVVVAGALHAECMARGQGREAVVKVLRAVGNGAKGTR